MTSLPDETRQGRWIGALAVLVLLSEQTALGFQLIAPTLLSFAAKFHTTQIIWMITIFTLVGGVLTPVVGKLGDRFGKRRILLAAAVVSMIGSVVCALTDSFAVLLVGRALMGLSMAFLPVTYALIRDIFPARRRAMSIGIASNGVGVVAVAGPFLAGYLIDHVSLESVFWFVGLLSLVGSLGTLALVPESPVRSDSRIDYVGAAALTAGLLAIMYGISQLATWRLTDPRTLLTIGGGVLVLVAWWFWERRTAEPFVDTRLLSSRPLATVLLSFAFSAGAGVVMSSYLPTMLQTPRALGGDYGFGLSATDVAVYIAPAGVLAVAVGILVGALAPRTGCRIFLIAGSLLGIVGALGVGFLRTESWMPIVFYAFAGLATMINAAATTLLMTVSPALSRGVTAGMASALGGAVGSLFAQLGGVVLSKNVGQVVQGQPIPTGHGMGLVFLIAAALFVVGTVLAVAVPERRPHSAQTSLLTNATVAAEPSV
ncbi:MFS transporter [Streptomyces sp. NPDC012616]|uniref:MFS transporter n=1 Tax=Streptomyces sp. NPDC012616 TaxID=3364840 RepID=UPI0036DFE131